jgi:AraC family transcriptional regulator
VQNPEIRELAPQPTIAVRVAVPMAGVDVGALVDFHLPGLAARAPVLGIAIAGPPYVRYHDWGGDVADLELGFPVDVPAGALPALASCTPGVAGAADLPAGRAAVLVHRGPYSGLPGAFRLLEAWCRDRGLDLEHGPWESYVDNPELVPPDELRTEVIWPLVGEGPGPGD